MNVSILNESHSPKIGKIREKYKVRRVLTMKIGNLNAIEFFNKDGVFRGFGRDTKAAFKRAKRAIKTYYK
jgi:hypothetical protein